MIATLFSKIWDLVAPYFSHPYVDIELKFDGYGKRVNGLIPSKEPIYVSEAVYNYDFHWDYVMIIKNNSSKPAFNVEMKEPPNYFHIVKPLDKTLSLQPFEKIEIQCFVRYSEAKTAFDSVEVLKQFPYFTDKIQIELSYQNERHKRFTTTFVYDKNGQKNEYSKK